MSNWRYLPYDVYSGAENMAIDEALLQAMAQKPDPRPVLRFYGWKPATLSLGYAQSFLKEVNEEACNRNGIDIVRRPTGGRAVLHEHELTYSVIAPEQNPNVAGTVIKSYLKISEALLKGLRSLGVEAEMVACAGKPQDHSAICFDAPSWYELVVDGRKLVGSAQVRKEGVLLQHGSILLHFDVERLFSLLRFPSEEGRLRLMRGFKGKACALDEVWTTPIELEELEREICSGFQDIMGIRLLKSQLTEQEELLKAEAVCKYKSDVWTKKR